MKRMDIVNALLARGFKAETQESIKNGIIVEGIVIRSEDPIAPIIYTDRLIRDAEEKRKSLADVVAEVIRIYEDNRYIDCDFTRIFDADFVREHVYIGLQKQSDENLVKNRCMLDDMEQYLFIRDEKDGDHFMVKVKADLLARICMTEQEAWENARKNTFSESMVRSLSAVIAEMCGIPEEDIDNGMNPIYVVSNRSGVRGASAILNPMILDDLRKKHDTRKFIILPSSIHEVLVLPYTDDMTLSIEDMTEMVQAVNSTEVLPGDQLSNQAYLIEI